MGHRKLDFTELKFDYSQQILQNFKFEDFFHRITWCHNFRAVKTLQAFTNY